MNCPNCSEPMILTKEAHNCPNDCLTIDLNFINHDGKIIRYSMARANIDLNKSYLLIGSKEYGETTLQVLDLLKLKERGVEIMPVIIRLNYFLSFDDKNQEEIDNLIPRLLNLKAFS